MMTERQVMEECLDALSARKGPAGIAWQTRVHRELQRRFPGAFVFRYHDALLELQEWLKAEKLLSDPSGLHQGMWFRPEKARPKVRPEGGWLVFRWGEDEYRVLAVCIHAGRWDYTYSWVLAPDREAAERLVEAVGRHKRCSEGVMVFEEGDWESAPRLAEDLRRHDWSSVILPEATRDRLKHATELFFRSEPVYRQLGIPWKLGILLVGPPGTGKTLTTKVLAATCGVPFLYVRGLNSFYERSPDAATVRKMFRGARERGPCLLCLEDVDSLVTEDLRSTFLNELDGLEEDHRGVLTIATTNYPERLDAALLHRPSRFDYRVEFPLPDDGQRRAFVRHWTEKLASGGCLEPDEPVGETVEEIVRRSRGMSHAYLQRVLIGTAMRMHTLEERGAAAFGRLALEELRDALDDRTIGRRAETLKLETNGREQVGFRIE